MTRPRPGWDFDYRPVQVHVPEEDAPDLVVATTSRVSVERAAAALRGAALRGAAGEVEVTEILAIPPLFWLRVRAERSLSLGAAGAALRGIGAGVRYVAPARGGSQRWAPPLRVSRAPRKDARSAKGHGSGAAVVEPAETWAVRAETPASELRGDGHWFLGSEGGGAGVDRTVTGAGAGTRLAVIDDDAAGVTALDLDAEVLVDLDRAPRAHAHGARMVGWAVGAPRAEPPFRGVAPDASPRLYLIPKPGISAVALPLAIVRAVTAGADVIVCATYVEGAWSPMLDDALLLAERRGRGGLGAVVVLPAGREASSPEGSVHASFSLSFGDPAADPRVLCVAPAAREGGWFFYRDRRGRSRPFANRGPSVRWLAPGDDLADPLRADGPPAHAESSGASAVAAGVVLLVLACNPLLRLREVMALLEATVRPVEPEAAPGLAPFADPHDTRPSARDRDGHNAKHGHGALSAAQACLAASDPVAWALVTIGEDEAARAFLRLRRGEGPVRVAYSVSCARWLVRVLLADGRASHAARALVRHVRLLSLDRRRRAAFAPGALAKQLALLLRGLLEGTAAGAPPRRLRAELRALLLLLGEHPSLEAAWLDVGEQIFDEP